MSSMIGLILLCILIIIYVVSNYGYNYETFMTDRDKVDYKNLTDGGLTPWTIDGNTKIVVSGIIKIILNKINNKINSHYYFVDFDHINTETSPCGVIKRYTSDFFVHDTYLQITKRMIIIFTLNTATLNVNVEHINLSNANKYPTPSFSQYYGNDLSITDDALITPNKYVITGIDDSRLDFSKFTPAHNVSGSAPGMPPAEFNQWILPVGITDAVYNMQSNYPCRNVTNFWDTNGVKVADAPTPLCQGIKNTPQLIPLRPYDNPTVNRQSTDINGNPSTKWLFDATENISGGNRMVGMS